MQFLFTSLEEYVIGFHDSAGTGNPTNGAYFYINGSNVVTGKCASNNNQTPTASTFTLTLSSWYRFNILVDGTGSVVTFTISDMSGGMLWSDTVATNIPLLTPMSCRNLGNSQDATAGRFYLNNDYLHVVMPTVR